MKLTALRHRRSFGRKLTVALIWVSLLMIAYTGAMSYRLASHKIVQMSTKLSEFNVDAVVDDTNDYLADMKSWTTQILAVSSLRTLSRNETPDENVLRTQGLNVLSAVRNELSKAMREGISFRHIGIYLQNGYCYSSPSQLSAPYADYEACLRYYQQRKLDISDAGYSAVKWSLCELTSATTGIRTTNPVLLRFIYNGVTMEKVGVAVFAVDEPALCETYTGLSAAGFLMDPNGLILSSADKPLIGTRCADEQLTQAVVGELPQSGTVTYRNGQGDQVLISYRAIQNKKAYLVMPFGLYTDISRQELTGYLGSISILMILGTVLAVLMALLLSRGLSRAIVGLTHFVKRVDAGESFDLRYTPSGEDEVAYLGEKINNMLDSLQCSAKFREDELQARQILELKLMQSQINPHLLYNTLDSVLWALHEKDAEGASSLVASLSEFFKHSLSRGRAEIPLSDELRLISHYINIQRLARQKSITMIYDIDTDLYEYPIIKLTFQPVIENAILHGFAGYRDDGTITIRATHTDHTLALTIADNGIGLLPEEVQTINDSLQIYPPPAQMRFFGLYNVNRRLVQTYGPAYGIRVSSQVSEYTQVDFHMPYDPHKGQKQEERNA